MKLLVSSEQMSGLILPGDILLKVNGKAVSGLDNPEEVVASTCTAIA